MKRLKLTLLLLLSLLLASAVTIFAQSGGGYNLTWNKIAGGGATFSTGSGYSLGGTIGQYDAGTLTGGGYTLNGGFWAGNSIPSANFVYLPLVVR